MCILSGWQPLPIEELREKAFTKFAIRLETVQLLYVGAGWLFFDGIVSALFLLTSCRYSFY